MDVLRALMVIFTMSGSTCPGVPTKFSSWISLVIIVILSWAKQVDSQKGLFKKAPPGGNGIEESQGFGLQLPPIQVPLQLLW